MRRSASDDIEGFILRWGAVAAGIALGAVLWPMRWAPACLFHRVTGYPCFTCGVTRAVKLAAGGHWGEAWRMQPLMMAAGVGLAVLMLVSAVRRAMGCPGWSWDRISPRWRWLLLAAGLIAVAVNWLYLIRLAI